MKRLLLISLLLISSAEIFAQTDKIKIESSIVGFFNGLSLVNPDTLKFYSTPDFQLLEDGEVWTLDTLIARVMPRQKANIQRINTFKFIRTEISGKMAWVSYDNAAEFRLGDKQQTKKWMESAVLVKNKGSWKIQLLHSTKLR
jgi:hypothetical protein